MDIASRSISTSYRRFPSCRRSLPRPHHLPRACGRARGVPLALAILGSGLGIDAFAEIRTPFARSLEDAGFRRITETHGVRAYQHRRAKVIHIAGEGELPAPPERVRALLLDYERHVGRVPRVSSSRILARDATSLLVHQRLGLPIIDDRDFVLRVHWGQDGPDLFIIYEAASHEGPPPAPGVVRVVRHSGSWQLRPIRAGQATFARYETRLDLGGSVPKWMARSRAGHDVPGLFRALCRMLDAASCP